MSVSLSQLRTFCCLATNDVQGTSRYRTPFPIACQDAIRLSLPQAKVLDRRRQGLGLVALAVARDLYGIPLKAVVVQDFAIGS
jgi:hypothetical protein